MRLPNSVLRPKFTVLLDERALPSEIHMVHRIGWLRTTVLGKNNGIGVAAAGSGAQWWPVSPDRWLVRCMAAREYVWVSSQADAEETDIAREPVSGKARAGTR